MNNIEVLEINFNNIKNDYKNHNVDLYVAKIELETIIKKLTKIKNEKIQSGSYNSDVVEIIFYAKKLLEEVEHDISIQEREETLRRNMQEEFNV